MQDASGAVLPAAKLTLTSLDQNRPYTALANHSGEYVFVQLPPGRYSLTAEATGFKKFLHSSLTLEVAQIAALEVRLEIGVTGEVIEVKTDAPLLDTASSTLGEVSPPTANSPAPTSAASPANHGALCADSTDHIQTSQGPQTGRLDCVRSRCPAASTPA